MRIPLLTLAVFAASAFADGHRLKYLDDDDPFYPHRNLARLSTPQWVGEEGVEAVVILSIDDLRETQKYEGYLRPVLERLKQIDGRAPFSIFCCQFPPDDPLFQTWLKEGVSLEVHTLAHPCPLLGKMDFAAAWQTVFGGLDLLAKIPGNTPRVFRMPCCDSMNSASPRFFAELLPDASKDGHFFAGDSSVGCLLTSADPALPRAVVLDTDGSERFRKYFPMELKPPTKLTFERFGAFIEDYPYPYVIGRGVWEFPFIVPSDWAASNAHGAKNPKTLEDWQAALDAIVVKQGVMTLVLHPHGWSDPAQIVALIDYAVEKYGKRVKFLNFPEALARLEKNVLGGETLRSTKGARLLDLNNDGYMDAVLGSATRVWSPLDRRWQVSPSSPASRAAHFAVLRKDGAVTMFAEGAWECEGGQWRAARPWLAGLDAAVLGKPGVRFRDFDGDGRGELLISNADGTTIYQWRDEKSRWEKMELAWPEGVSLVNERGEDHGLRFVDLNGDGFDDLVFSNEERSSIHLWANQGWTRVGTSRRVPPIVRAGPHRNNGAWFRGGRMFVQNEDTAKLGNVVEMRTFQELLDSGKPALQKP